MPRRTHISRKLDSLYIGKSTFLKVFLLGGVALISAVFIWYTFSVIEKLKADTRLQVEKYVRIWQMAANSPTSGSELQFIFDEIIVKATFPIIVLDSDREPIHWRNIPSADPSDTSSLALAKMKSVAEKMFRENGEFSLHLGEGHLNYFRYGNPAIIGQLRMMPFIEIGIVLAFMIVGIIGFQNIRRSEERHIWIGMAKETAHQLGTPISSLLGWLEVLRGEDWLEQLNTSDRESLNNTLSDMEVDVDRLQKVANRFGQIGSVPELKPCDLDELVQDAVDYYRRRLPFQGEGIQITFDGGQPGRVALNAELFGWALENMIKNALQAIDAKEGRIKIETELVPRSKEALILITDNGSGITSAAGRKIFRAGFTTKKRGWGLGLTLVKRIVEEYHGGRIALKSSRAGQTCFEIRLPKEETELQTNG
ncbi:MAG: PAS domain-containing sensor histidine kinase [Candidatus Zixiibacteriota bacterium]